MYGMAWVEWTMEAWMGKDNYCTRSFLFLFLAAAAADDHDDDDDTF
jgi:hypothetical protein